MSSRLHRVHGLVLACVLVAPPGCDAPEASSGPTRHIAVLFDSSGRGDAALNDSVWEGLLEVDWARSDVALVEDPSDLSAVAPAAVVVVGDAQDQMSADLCAASTAWLFVAPSGPVTCEGAVISLGASEQAVADALALAQTFADGGAVRLLYREATAGEALTQALRSAFDDAAATPMPGAAPLTSWLDAPLDAARVVVAATGVDGGLLAGLPDGGRQRFVVSVGLARDTTTDRARLGVLHVDVAQAVADALGAALDSGTPSGANVEAEFRVNPLYAAHGEIP